MGETEAHFTPLKKKDPSVGWGTVVCACQRSVKTAGILTYDAEEPKEHKH